MSQYPEVKAIASAEHPEIAWIGLDSSKRQSSSHLVLVIQSTAEFALKTLDITDLMPAGQVLLQQAAVLAPWIQETEWVQVHRWRYAFAVSTLGQPYWVAETSAPLICSGDWCSGMRVEDAYQSALKTADYLHSRLTTKLSRL